MHIIILAAGMGTRLNKNNPKSLVKLSNGDSILNRQINALLDYVNINDITIVVGYKQHKIKEKYPKCSYVYNENYQNTNTAKSLLLALESKEDEKDVIWINGDVVFEFEVLKEIFVTSNSSMLVNTLKVGAEEVKYTINNDGSINKVSKNINNGLGEAVGINKILNSQLDEFKKELERCSKSDYFERGLEMLINKGTKIYPIDISKYFCCEIDTQDDLNFVNRFLKSE
tara:strand:+ start:437 stop:1120 length:684 start_codon:yes stop_codon:yes gene_type:complete